MPTDFRLRRRVQFYETDAAGIVHFSWFFRYMEEAEHAMWRAAGVSIRPPSSDIGWPRVAASFEFYRALKFEDEFEIAIRVDKLSKRSISYACALIKDDQEIASGTMTIACVRKDPTLHAVEIPAEIVEMVERLQK
jgi:YbgC/YbaW family acyl-CoA thioester hydrolase